MTSLKHWGALPEGAGERMRDEATVDCGWGRLVFGQTYASPERLAEEIRREAPGRRDVALYIRDPHVVIALAPQQLFLDPSHTFRLALRKGPAGDPVCSGIAIRSARPEDEPAVNRIYLSRSMVPVRAGFFADARRDPSLELLVAEDADSGAILGGVTGVDHVAACDDPDGGSSLWSLTVDPQGTRPGVGEALVRALAARFGERGRGFMDLSVMHDNAEAIGLYEKLGFERVPVYCVKNKNPINEKLFVGPDSFAGLNVYARILVDEARRRGIGVEVIDAEHGYFRLGHGGRTITCRESLSELTSAVAMSRCDDKRVTRRLLTGAGLRMPDQIPAGDDESLRAFLDRHGRVVVKPARGEQGHGVKVDLRSLGEVKAAIDQARRHCEDVIVEELVPGEDLRIVVIDYQVVAAATRRPARVIGDGENTVRRLIDKQSRRRQAATGGESAIPLDAETERCVMAGGKTMSSVLAPGETLIVRRTANLHTGGTIHDETARLHPKLAEVAIRAARALEIPVVGFDLMVPDVTGDDYAIIEANERPGLANHEPQPTAERFVDLLFPQTRTGS
ncbi:N-acetylglutaminylglutamine synthetase [Zeimonas arvi]|uniref:N-acetylglutaminylglutamine synthetase n=2 Tax=Zeimonas arvi TaxID=2498847 RepID=A0A5C8P5M1_9BURK|nr:N-acetylglutaminylglutamine synthetase [Zeimonas arvi]